MRDFFECHEYGEHLWLDSGRPEFLKGLIQVAVSLYHLENGNVKGSRMLWRTASKYLSSYRPIYWGIDVDRIYSDMNDLHARVPKGDRVHPNEVAAWELPQVFIQIKDDALEEIVRNWNLSERLDD